MSIRLKQRAGMLVAGVALSAASLAILPGVAETKDIAAVPTTTVESVNVGPTNASAVVATPTGLPDDTTPSEPATRLVVNPGDSLWSISQGRLHPNANPQQIMSEVERIFELNRDRVGDSPDLILPGQELLLPPVAEPAPAVSEQAPVPVSEPVALPDLPTAETVPMTSVSVEPSAEFHAFWRRLLGLGVMILSLAVAILMVWKLPMKRDPRSFAAWKRSDRAPLGLSAKHQRSTGVLSGEPAAPPKAQTQRRRVAEVRVVRTRLGSPKDSRGRKVNDGDAA